MTVNYRGLQTSVLPSYPSYSADHGVSYYQSEFLRIAEEAIRELGIVLDLDGGSIDVSVNVTGYGAAATELTDLDIV